MRQFFVQRWFLIALALVIAAGMSTPERMKPFADALPRQLIVGGVLFLMAVTLDIRAMARVVRRPLAPLLAIGINFLLLPPLAWVVARLLGPLLPGGLSTGFIVAASVPCTLASAAVWTRRAGGNDSVALFVTVATNLACFMVTPAWLKLLTARAIEMPYIDMVAHLAQVVVLPIVLAQLLRLAEPVRRGATAGKTQLGVLAQLGILSIILVGAVDSGLRLGDTSSGGVSVVQWATLIGGVMVLHLGALFAGYSLATSIGLSRPDAQAVGIAGSQKTLMVGLEIAIVHYGGLAILPLVVYHVGQLLVDTIIADRWRRQGT